MFLGDIDLEFSFLVISLILVSEQCWPHKMTGEVFLPLLFLESEYIELIVFLP